MSKKFSKSLRKYHVYKVVCLFFPGIHFQQLNNRYQKEVPG